MATLCKIVEASASKITLKNIAIKLQITNLCMADASSLSFTRQWENVSSTKVNSSSYLQPLQVKKNQIAAELTRHPQFHPLLTELHPCCPSTLSSLRSFSALDWLHHKKHLKRFLGSTINKNTCINITTSFLSRIVALDKSTLLTSMNSITTFLALEHAFSEETPSPLFK